MRDLTCNRVPGVPSPRTPTPPIDDERVIDIREWRTPAGMRRLRAPRALWARTLGDRGDQPASSRTPTIVPAAEDTTAMTKAASAADAAAPILLVGCSEARLVEPLRLRLGAACVLQNLGGVVPRSARTARANPDVATLDAALDDLGVRHVVVVGHRGCRVTHASVRYAGLPGRITAADVERETRAIEHHVFTQLQHVRTYLRQRAHAPAVRVTGLWIDEQSGHVHGFDPAQRRFTLLRDFDIVRYSATIPGRGTPEPADA